MAFVMVRCRLCLRLFEKAECTDLAPGSTNWKIRNYQMLKFIFPELNLRLSDNTQACHDCIQNLEVSYRFKMKFIETKPRRMNESYKRKEEKQNDRDALCKLCATVCSTFALIDTDTKLALCNDMCREVIGVTFRETKPVMCVDCWKTLETAYGFKICCIRTERKLQNYLSTNNTTKLNSLAFEKFSLENYPPDLDSSDGENDDINEDEACEEMSTKSESEESVLSSVDIEKEDETVISSDAELSSCDEDMEDDAFRSASLLPKRFTTKDKITETATSDTSLVNQEMKVATPSKPNLVPDGLKTEGTNSQTKTDTNSKEEGMENRPDMDLNVKENKSSKIEQKAPTKAAELSGEVAAKKLTSETPCSQDNTLLPPNSQGMTSAKAPDAETATDEIHLGTDSNNSKGCNISKTVAKPLATETATNVMKPVSDANNDSTSKTSNTVAKASDANNSSSSKTSKTVAESSGTEPATGKVKPPTDVNNSGSSETSKSVAKSSGTEPATDTVKPPTDVNNSGSISKTSRTVAKSSATETAMNVMKPVSDANNDSTSKTSNTAAKASDANNSSISKTSKTVAKSSDTETVTDNIKPPTDANNSGSSENSNTVAIASDTETAADEIKPTTDANNSGNSRTANTPKFIQKLQNSLRLMRDQALDDCNAEREKRNVQVQNYNGVLKEMMRLRKHLLEQHGELKAFDASIAKKQRQVDTFNKHLKAVEEMEKDITNYDEQ